MNGALAIASAPRHDARAIQKIEDPDLKPHAGFRLPACLHKNKMRPFGPVRTLYEEREKGLRGGRGTVPSASAYKLVHR